MLQSGKDDFNPRSCEIREGIVPLFSFSPTIVSQGHLRLCLLNLLKSHGDVGALLSNLTQVRRSIPSNRQHSFRLKRQNPYAFSSSSAKLGFGVKVDLVWAIDAKFNIAGRSQEGLGALLCGPCVPHFVSARADNRFDTYDSFRTPAGLVIASSQLSEQ